MAASENQAHERGEDPVVRRLDGDGPRYPMEALLEYLDPLYEATMQATEEAIINALVAAETMVGIDRHRVQTLPLDRVSDILGDCGRLATLPDVDTYADHHL